MKTVFCLLTVLSISLSASMAYADGEAKIQQIERALNTSLTLPQNEQLAIIAENSAKVAELIEHKEITIERAQLTLAFIDAQARSN